MIGTAYRVSFLVPDRDPAVQVEFGEEQMRGLFVVSFR